MVDLSDDSGPYSPGTRAPYSEKEVNHQTGLEVDYTQDGLRTVLDTAGLEAVPAEYQKGAIPQTNFQNPEKEAWNSADKELVSPDESKGPERQSILKRRWKLWALLATLLVIIVVVAVAVPLSVHKSRYVCRLAINEPTTHLADQCSLTKFYILSDRHLSRPYFSQQYFARQYCIEPVRLGLHTQGD